MFTAIDDLIRVDLTWWDVQRIRVHVPAADLKYMNSLVISKILPNRIVYMQRTDRAVEILERVAAE